MSSEPDLIDTGREILTGLLSANHVAFQTEKVLGNFCSVWNGYIQAELAYDIIEGFGMSSEV